jgi:hypothetical protein
MHECLYALMRQHLTVQLAIPQGSKTRKPESNSMGKYCGGPKFNELEDWLTNLVIMFEAKQYSVAEEALYWGPSLGRQKSGSTRTLDQR